MPRLCLLKCSTIDNEYTLTISGVINEETSDTELEFSPRAPITSVKIDGLRLTDLAKLETVFDELKANHRVSSFTCHSLDTNNPFEPMWETSQHLKPFISILANFIGKNIHLKKLSLTKCKLYSHDLDRLLTQLDCWDTLTEIDFSDNQLDTLNLPAPNQLTAIKLRNNRFSKKTLAAIYHAVAKNKKIRHLDFITKDSDHYIKDARLLIAADLPLESLAVCIGKYEEATQLAELIINTNTLYSLEVMIEVASIDIASITNTIIHAITNNHTLDTLSIAISGHLVETDIERNLAVMVEKNTRVRHITLRLPIIKIGSNNPLAKAIAMSDTLLTFHLSSYINEHTAKFLAQVMQSVTLLDFHFINLAESTIYLLDASSVNQKNKDALLARCRSELDAKTNPFERYAVLDKYVMLINDMQDQTLLFDICYNLKKIVYPELCTYYIATNNLGAYLEIAELPEADPHFKKIIAWLWWTLSYVKNPPCDDTMLVKLSAYFSDDLLDPTTLLEKICTLLILYLQQDYSDYDEELFIETIGNITLFHSIEADTLKNPQQFSGILQQFKQEQFKLRHNAEARDAAITRTVPTQLISFFATSTLLEEKNPPGIMTAIQSIRQLLIANTLPPYVKLKKIAEYALAKHPMRLWLLQHRTLAHRCLAVIANAYDYPHLDKHPLFVIPSEARDLHLLQMGKCSK